MKRLIILLLCALAASCNGNGFLKDWFAVHPLKCYYNYGAGEIELPLEEVISQIDLPPEAARLNFTARGDGQEGVSFSKNPLLLDPDESKTLNVTVVTPKERITYWIIFSRPSP